MNAGEKLFAFESVAAEAPVVLETIRRYAAHEAFRSATVDELILAHDAYRWPLRPEDLGFLKFDEPVQRTSVSRLPALAAHRLLMTINDLSLAPLPRTVEGASFARLMAFAGDRNQVLGAAIRPFLEACAFDYVSPAEPDRAGQEPGEVLATEQGFWDGLWKRLARRDYLRSGFELAAIQRWLLLPTKLAALARVEAAALALGLELPRPSLAPIDEARFAALVGSAIEATRPRAYWQFYLPTSMAECNFLHALAQRPHRALELIGAAFVAEAQALAFAGSLVQRWPELASSRGGSLDAAAALEPRWARCLEVVEGRFGAAGRARLAAGVAAAARLAESARWDLATQLDWLSTIDSHLEAARRLHQFVETEHPDIDRETFVEPREMCSTTHVHNEHRLVVVESGDMVFWGNVGMQLSLSRGDMVLIPDGRLHGSTVTSAECTYHQPILLDAWVRATLDRIGAERDALGKS